MTPEELITRYKSGHIDFAGLDLHRIQLQGADLIGANFSGSNLQCVNLVLAFLSRTNFHQANLLKLYRLDLATGKCRGWLALTGKKWRSQVRLLVS